MLSPKVTWTLAGVPVQVSDWSCNSVANGGFDQMRGSMMLKEWHSLAPAPTQGSVVTAYLPNGNVMWEGRLSAPPDVKHGGTEFAAQGHKVALERQTDRRFYVSRDYSLWQSADDLPFLFTTIDDINVNLRNAGAVISATPGITYATNDLNGIIIWVPGSLLTRVIFTAWRPRSTATWEIRTARFTGPTGSRTTEDTTTLAVGWSGAPGSQTVNVTLDPAEDGCRIALAANGASTPGNPVTVRITDLRIYGLTTTLNYSVQEVLAGLAAEAAIDFNSDGVSTALSGAGEYCMPLDWEGTWGDLCDYVCMIRDATWRVLETGSDSKPRMEAFKWSAATDWKVRRATGAQADLTPLELFNEVTVSYPGMNGSTRQVTVAAATDPLSASGITNTHLEELEDVQEANTLATAVATALVAKLSTQRYEGTIEVTSAMNAAGRDAAWEVKGGDTVTLEDWAPGESRTMRVHEVEYTPEGVTLGIEQDVSSDRMLARAMLREQQSRKKKNRRG